MVDFARMNQIKYAIEHEVVRGHGEIKGKAICVPRWQSVMDAILRLPVAPWDCPAAVSGEIDTEKAAGKETAMSWGNNNGNQNNGNGRGYGGDVYDRLNNTKDVGGARFPFIEDGKHRLALVSLEEFQHSSDGPSARAILKVLESVKHQPGSFVVKIWKLVKPSKFPNQPTDADQFADFCRKLKGAPQGHPIGNDIRALMKDRVREQLARGTMIDCVGVANKKLTYVNTYWNAVEQSPEQIAQLRARLEQEGVPDSGGAPPTPLGYQDRGQQLQSPVPQQNAAQGPTAPQGGFLAQLPPNGNGGGNGRW